MPELVRSLPAAVATPPLRTVRSRLGDYPLLWLALLYTVVSGLLLALALGSIRQQAVDTSQRTLEAFTRVIEEMTTRSLETAHLRLELASDEIRHLGPTADAAAARSLLKKHLEAMPFANSMWIMDANGRVIAGTAEESPPLDRSDRDYFMALRNAPRTSWPWDARRSAPSRNAGGCPWPTRCMTRTAGSRAS